jgi:hypothetical protein
MPNVIKTMKAAGGFFELFILDLVGCMAQPETHSFVEVQILKPLLSRLFRILYPYLIGVLLLWILMFACLAIILLLVMRGK